VLDTELAEAVVEHSSFLLLAGPVQARLGLPVLAVAVGF